MNRFYDFLKEVDYLSLSGEKSNYNSEQIKLKEKFQAAMDDDFNTAKAISVLFDIIKNYRKSQDTNFAHLLVELGRSLGFFQKLEEQLADDLNQISEELIKLMINYRIQFKKEKNWEMADQIRNDLEKIGIRLKDTADGTDWKLVK